MAGDADRARLAYKQESTYGTNPASTDWDRMRFTGETLAKATNYKQSDEISDDRQVTGVFRASSNVGGAINGRFSYETWDDWIEAALCGTWVAAQASIVAESDISVTATTGTYTTAAGDFVTDGLLPGMWVTIAGFTESGNNGRKRIATVATSTFTVYDNTGMADEIAGDSITIDSHKYVKNGTTFRSYTIERYYTDLGATNEYALFTGCAIDQMQMTLATEDLMALVWTILGKDEATSDTAAGTGYTTGTPTTGDLLNAIDNIQKVVEYDWATEVDPTQFGWTIANNLRERKVFSTVGPKSLGTGKSVVSGSMNIYYEDATAIAIVGRYLAGTWSSIGVELVDSLGNLVLLDFPRIKYTQAPRAAGGENQDIIPDIQWQASKHPTEGFTVQVTVIPV